MPQKLTAHTGMDALTHAIEAYVSTANCAYTDPLAIHAIEMIQKDLIDSYNGNMGARDRMHDAQCLAGMAFSNALLGIVHSMAHKTGAAFAAYGSTFLTASRTMVQTAIHVSRDSFLRTYSLRDSLRSLRTLSQTLAQVLTHVSLHRKKWKSSSSAATTIQKLISNSPDYRTESVPNLFRGVFCFFVYFA